MNLNIPPFTTYNSDIAKRILMVAYPIVLGNISRALMGIVDMIMVGRLGVHSIAAVGFGEMLVFSLIMGIGISTMTSTQTITSRRFGEGVFSKCSEALFNGQLLGIALGFPCLVLGFMYCHDIIEFFLDDPKTISECTKYTTIQFLGILFPISCFIYRGFYTGIQKTAIYFKIVIISNLINIYLNLGLIFGTDKFLKYLFGFDNPIINYFGLIWTIIPFPEMGIKGAALGTVISSIFSFLCFFFYYFSNEIHSKFHLDKIAINYILLKKQLQLSWPVIKREGSIGIGLAIFFAIMGMIGTMELAASNIVLRIYNIALMPAFGIGAACSSIVGYYLGKNNPNFSWIAVKDSLRYSLLIMGSVALCFIIFPKSIVTIFTSDIDLQKITISLLKFVGFVALIDAVATVLICTLEGAGDVKFTSLITLVFIWVINIPLIYLTGVYLDLGLWGPWYSWMVGFLFLLFMLIRRVAQGEWKFITL